MSQQTQGKRLFYVSSVLLAVFLAVLAPSLGNAGAVSDAQEQLNKAYDDYYDAMSTGGKKTPEEQKTIRQRIVEPAMNNLNQAMKQESDEVVREHAKELPPSKAGNSALGSTSTTTDAPAPAKTREPEVILESTDIPRELEFPGKPVQHPAVPAESYSGPYAPKSR